MNLGEAVEKQANGRGDVSSHVGDRNSLVGIAYLCGSQAPDCNGQLRSSFVYSEPALVPNIGARHRRLVLPSYEFRNVLLFNASQLGSLDGTEREKVV